MTETIELMEVRQKRVVVGPCWLVGAPTALVDSFSPRIELIRLPAAICDAKTIQVKLVEGEHFPLKRRYDRLRRIVGKRIPTLEMSEPFLDARDDTQNNLGHVLYHQVASAILGAELLEQRGQQALRHIVMAADAPAYALNAARFFGFEPVLTNGAVRGPRLHFSAKPGINLSVQTLTDRVAQHLSAPTNSEGRLFVARRGSRSITNQDEIARLLQGQGFRCVFMEDYSIAEQWSLMAGASEVVGIHGANLAFLPIRAKDSPPLRLVELYGPGYIVTAYRLSILGIGQQWVGVRGAVTPEVVRDVVQRRKPRSHESTSFMVDPGSVESALQIVRGGPAEVEPIVTD